MILPPQPGSKRNRLRKTGRKDLDKALKKLIAAGCTVVNDRKHFMLRAPDGSLSSFATTPRADTARAEADKLLKTINH